MTLISALLLGCAPAGPQDSATTCDAVGPLDATLRLPDVQALGTHNSYHVEPPDPVDDSHRYTQPPLDVQADVGVRAFELDVHLGTDGAFRVFHLPVVDPLSTCDTLTACLGVLRAWSDRHPCHTPFTVWIEPKDDIDAAVEGLVPLAGHMTELDAAVREGWGEGVFEPDELRARLSTLPEAVARGWPLLADLRGRVLFALLDSGEHRAEYLDGSPALEGRALFVDGDTAADSFAATFKIDDAPGEAERVAELVSAGFLVSSNLSDGHGDDAGSAASLDATIEAGPHYLASDQVIAVEGSAYAATLPGGSPRCHPSRVPAGCGPADLEPGP